MNTRKLIEKASFEGLDDSTIATVVDALRSGSVDDPYSLLLILGRAGAKEHIDIVEGYLYYPENPMMSRLALQILCRYWGMACKYRDTIKEFILGVDWDAEEDVRLMAIGCSEYLMKADDIEIFRIVYGIFHDEHVEQTLRDSAYFALAKAVGKSVLQLPPASRHLDHSKDLEPDVIKKVELKISDC